MSGLPVAAWTEEEWHWDIEDEAWAYAEAWDEYRKTNRQRATSPKLKCPWWVQERRLKREVSA